MIAISDTEIVGKKERETLRLRARLLDDARVPIPVEDIVTWTLTRYCRDNDARSIINGRENVALVTAGVVATNLNGLFRYELDADDILTAFFAFPPEDQAIVTGGKIENHVCQFLIVTNHNGEQDTIRPKFDIQIENLGRVL